MELVPYVHMLAQLMGEVKSDIKFSLAMLGLLYMLLTLWFCSLWKLGNRKIDIRKLKKEITMYDNFDYLYKKFISSSEWKKMRLVFIEGNYNIDSDRSCENPLFCYRCDCCG